jgi:hypothetical protein
MTPIEKIAFIHQSAWDIPEVAELIDSNLPNSVEYGEYRARAYSDDNEARLIATTAQLGFYAFDDNDFDLVDSMMKAGVKAVFLCTCEVARQLASGYSIVEALIVEDGADLASKA